MPKGRARFIRRLLLCAALGVLTNIAVAWAITWWLPIKQGGTRLGYLGLDDYICEASLRDQFGRTDVWWSARRFDQSQDINPAWFIRQAKSRPPVWSSIWSPDEREIMAKRPLRYRDHFETAIGWPLRSFLFGHVPLIADETATISYLQQSRPEFKGAFAVELPGQYPSLTRYIPLPYRPIWPAFLINSALYATLWFALLFIPTALRPRARRRRNACLSCGYDLQGLSPTTPCPECGAANNATTKYPAEISTTDA